MLWGEKFCCVLLGDLLWYVVCCWETSCGEHAVYCWETFSGMLCCWQTSCDMLCAAERPLVISMLCVVNRHLVVSMLPAVGRTLVVCCVLLGDLLW